MMTNKFLEATQPVILVAWVLSFALAATSWAAKPDTSVPAKPWVGIHGVQGTATVSRKATNPRTGTPPLPPNLENRTRLLPAPAARTVRLPSKEEPKVQPSARS